MNLALSTLAIAFGLMFTAFWLTVAVVLVRDAWREWRYDRETRKMWQRLLK